MPGKLNGTIAATTPSGCRIMVSSIPRATSSRVALHHHRDAAGDFDVLDRAPQLGFSFSESLPVFLRDDPAQFVKVILKKLLQLEERLNAVFRWRAAPFRPCRCGCFNGTGYFSGA